MKSISLIIIGIYVGWELGRWHLGWVEKRKARLNFSARGARSVAEPMFDVDIIINGRPARTHLQKVSYSQIVELAGKKDFVTVGGVNRLDIRGEKQFRTLYTVTWGIPRHPDNGSLKPGESVIVRDGMVFNVVDTSHA